MDNKQMSSKSQYQGLAALLVVAVMLLAIVTVMVPKGGITGFLINNETGENITSNESIINQTDRGNGLGILSNGSCVVPYEDMVITTDTTFCSGTYYLNDSNGNGAIQIGADNVVLDCNYSEVIGNSITGSIGISITYSNNITIKDCLISGGYTYGIENIYNNIDNKILNNVFKGNYSNSAIYLNAGIRTIIDGNYFNSTNKKHIDGYSASDSIITRNIFMGNTTRYAIYLSGSNISIINNAFNQTYKDDYIVISSNSPNLIIENNSFSGYNVSDAVINFYLGINSAIIRNNTFIFNSNTPSYFMFGIVTRVNPSNNITIINNTFKGIDAINLNTVTNSLIANNYFGEKKVGGYATVFISHSENIRYQSNSMINGCNMLAISNSRNISVLDSLFYNETFVPNVNGTGCMYLIDIVGNGSVEINNNTLNSSDVPIYLETGASNVKIFNNVIDNANTYTDYWASGIHVSDGSYNIIIINNSIINFGTEGVLISRSNNITINNNYFNELSMTKKLQFNSTGIFVGDAGEITSAIGILEIYKGWNADGKSTYSCGTGYDTCSLLRSTNINVYNNTFGNDTQVYLRLQGTQNITHDLNPLSYWYREFSTATEISDRDKIYVNNNFDILNSFNTNKSEPTYYFNRQQQWAYYIVYTISKNNMTFSNIHNWDISDTRSWTIGVYSASLAYPYNDVKNVSNGVILASNVDSYSITLAPNQQIIVGNFTNKSGPPAHPTSVTVTLSSPSSTINDDLTCDYSVTGNDANVSIAWYKNDVLTLFNTSILSKSNLVVGDTWYCEVTAVDAYNSTIVDSNYMTIQYIIYNNPSLTVSLSSNLNCTYTAVSLNNLTLNISIEWFKDSVNVLNGTSYIANTSYGSWYCKVNASDAFNSTVLSSNTVVLSPPAQPSSSSSSGGGGSGGGGGGGSRPVSNTTKPDITKNVSQNTNNASNASAETSTISTVEEPVTPTNQTPTVEQPTVIHTSLLSQWYVYLIVMFIIAIPVLLTLRRPKVQTDDMILKFIRNSLQAGYTKHAIRHVLKLRYSSSIVRHHLSQIKDKPVKRPKAPQSAIYPQNTINQLTIYIQHQKQLGFKENHIKQALINYGYSKKVVDSLCSP